MDEKPKEKPRPQKWVWVECTNPNCRGLIKYCKPFKVQVLEGNEAHAECNECFCK